MNRLSVIIPFYNEEEGIEYLASQILPVFKKIQDNWEIELLLIDDGSDDQTYELLERHFAHLNYVCVQLIKHPQNRGIGAALRTGVINSNGDIIVTLDCDCTYHPREIPNIVDILLTSGCDVVTASPYHPSVKIDHLGWRIMLSLMANRIYRWIVPTKLSCYTCFFRAYRRDRIKLQLDFSDSYMGVAESLIRMSYEGSSIQEFPMPLGIRLNGQSKMKCLRVIGDHLRLMSRLVFNRNIYLP